MSEIAVIVAVTIGAQLLNVLIGVTWTLIDNRRHRRGA